MSTHRLTASALCAALACATAVLCPMPAKAGPSQAGVGVPGGFVAACATDLSAGVGYTPGGDLVAAFTGYTSRTQCQGQYFAGAAGSTAAASYGTATVQNSASVSANLGVIGLVAANSAPGYEQFPVSAAGGGWSDGMVINLVGHAGEAAIWRFRIHADGSLASSGPGGAGQVMVNAFKNQVELGNDIAGFDKGASDSFATDRQRVAWAVDSGANRLVDDSATFAVLVTLGQPFVWGVYARAQTGMRSWASVPWISSATLDFGDGLQYGGSVGLSVGGVDMDGYTLQATSGIDWMQPASAVPEPAAWAMWTAGLLGLALRRRYQAHPM